MFPRARLLQVAEDPLMDDALQAQVVCLFLRIEILYVSITRLCSHVCIQSWLHQLLDYIVQCLLSSCCSIQQLNAETGSSMIVMKVNPSSKAEMDREATAEEVRRVNGGIAVIYRINLLTSSFVRRFRTYR